MIYLEFTDRDYKRRYIFTEINNLLHDYHCTFSDVDDIIDSLQDFYRQMRDDIEYDGVSPEDLFSHRRSCNADEKLVSYSNHYAPYA